MKPINSELRQQHPTEPWNWREDWHSGTLSTDGKSQLMAIAIMAIAWNVFSWAMTFFILPSELKGENYLALLILIFPLAGIGFAIAAIRSAMHYLKFGESTFTMAFNPGVIGGPLVGVIRTGLRLQPNDGFKISLTCFRRTIRGSGKRRRVHDDILFQTSQRLGRQLENSGETGGAIPVQFAIPFDSQESKTQGKGKEGDFWKLEVTADVPGVDYHAAFEVPVFKTGESDPDYQADTSLVEEYVHVPTVNETYQEAGLSRREKNQETEIRFPMFRHVSSAIATTFVAIICIGGSIIPAYGILNSDSFGLFSMMGLMFGAVFALVGLLFVLVALDLWLWNGKLSVSNEKMTIKLGLAGFAPEVVVKRNEIKSFAFKKSMQTGNAAYYDLKMETEDGKFHCIGKRIVNEATVRRIIEDVMTQMQLPANEIPVVQQFRKRSMKAGVKHEANSQKHTNVDQNELIRETVGSK